MQNDERYPDVVDGDGGLNEHVNFVVDVEREEEEPDDVQRAPSVRARAPLRDEEVPELDGARGRRARTRDHRDASEDLVPEPVCNANESLDITV